MSLTSFGFFVFLLFTCVAYYAIKSCQKIILFAASLFFYVHISYAFGIQNILILILVIWILSYAGALLLQRVCTERRPMVLFGLILSLISILFVFKYAYNLLSIVQTLFHLDRDISFLKFVSIIGVSYYVLSAIGYLVEVYWGNLEADKDILNVGLFIFFFPQLISGPLTRYQAMQSQFNRKHSLRYDTISHGLRRMIWGYFQKLVISERFAIIVSSVYGNIDHYGGLGILMANLAYAIRLYTDFSGCMDIVLGTAMLFDIQLPENFNAPFFSESIQEFWQRWHITLGIWFKDYVMYPLQKSGPMQKCGKLAKHIIGKKYGKKIPFHLSMLVLWFLIGIWHGGTAYYFIASGLIPCVLLIFSELLNPVSIRFYSTLHIERKNKIFCLCRRIKTQVLLCLCWIFVNAESTGRGIRIIKYSLKHPLILSTQADFPFSMGLSYRSIFIMFFSLAILLFVEQIKYRNSTIFLEMDKKPFLTRIFLIYCELILILFCGKVGTSAFIYFQF